MVISITGLRAWMSLSFYLVCGLTQSRDYISCARPHSRTTPCGGVMVTNAKVWGPILSEPVGKAVSEHLCQHMCHGKAGFLFLLLGPQRINTWALPGSTGGRSVSTYLGCVLRILISTPGSRR